MASEELAWLPLLLPVGDDASGTYLLHLEPGDVVSLEGPDAPSMLAAWVEAAKSWPWAEQVGVARDSETAEALAPLFFGQRTPEERATVLFTGDPSVLSESAARTVASVTSNSSRATTSVTVTAEGAVIEPFDIAVRPCRLDPASEGALAAIDDQRLTRAVDAVNEETEVPGESSENVRGVTTLGSSAELVGAGPIEVRLLTFTPQIVGLSGPLPTSKAVRITELVAWLALQGTKGSTSASMLDHGIVGATSTKTLYNMVSAARTALGTDASGASRLIADRSTGVYRLAEDVTVDVFPFHADGKTRDRLRRPPYSGRTLHSGAELDRRHPGRQRKRPLRLVGEPMGGPDRSSGHQGRRSFGRAGKARGHRSRGSPSVE